MKTYKGIIFDLDGTLLDTIEDLRDSVNDVMKIYGWKEHDTKACKQMVGNGFRKLITRALPEDKQKNELFIDEAVNQFSKAYQKRYLNKTIPYEGIPDCRQTRCWDHPSTIFSFKVKLYPKIS